VNKSHNAKSGSRIGWWIFIGLAVVTAIEYVIAVALNINLFFLAQIAVLKAGLIVVYFMHVPRAWQRVKEEEEE
jgi:caa(3)-type oxidase subunit IV